MKRFHPRHNDGDWPNLLLKQKNSNPIAIAKICAIMSFVYAFMEEEGEYDFR